jgi:hypothetical protein
MLDPDRRGSARIGARGTRHARRRLAANAEQYAARSL